MSREVTQLRLCFRKVSPAAAESGDGGKTGMGRPG